MTRSYRPVKELEPTIFQKKAEGKSNREIREEYGLSKNKCQI